MAGTSDDALPAGLTRADLDSVDVDKLKASMVRSIYLAEALLFAQAEHEARDLVERRRMVEDLRGILYDPEILSLPQEQGGYSVRTKIELLALASTMHQNGLRFLENLNKSVAAGMEAVRAIERGKPGGTGGPQTPHQKKATREVRQLIERKMAERVKELESGPGRGDGG